MAKVLGLSYFKHRSTTMIIKHSKCSHFKSVILIGPFKISADNYHAVDDSALCVFTLLPMVESMDWSMDSQLYKRPWSIFISNYLDL